MFIIYNQAPKLLLLRLVEQTIVDQPMAEYMFHTFAFDRNLKTEIDDKFFDVVRILNRTQPKARRRSGHQKQKRMKAMKKCMKHVPF